MKKLSFHLRTLALSCITLLALALAGCGGKTVEPAAPGPLDGATDHKLAYGISLKVPQGWRIVGTTQENTPPAAELKKIIAKKKNVNLLHMVRTLPNGEICAEVIFSLVHSESSPLPENLVQRATPQDFEQFDQAEMLKAQQVAAKEKRKNDLLEVRSSRVTIGTQMALETQILGQRPDGGTMRVMQYDIYLPESTTLLVFAKGQPEVAGLEEQMKALTHSITATRQ